MPSRLGMTFLHTLSLTLCLTLTHAILCQLARICVWIMLLVIINSHFQWLCMSACFPISIKECLHQCPSLWCHIVEFVNDFLKTKVCYIFCCLSECVQWMGSSRSPLGN